jgi:peptidoglycan/LPS O-acetylase OafA/YrhL
MPNTTTVSARRAARPLAAIAIAATVTGLAWVAGRTAGITYLVDTPLGVRQVGLALTVAATAMAGAMGWGVLALLRRHSRRPRVTWIVLGIVVLAASIVPVFATPAPLSTQLMLSALHCVAAAVVIPGLAVTIRPPGSP